uniref:Uncharacterized protein n=1 Tax=Utricularia reniformis TaxID=192314 RepID=A0A1Y0B416_9LAMI|nr:hypothetical protein AEK19_MT1971 [Utricularia reniformis]ART32134.1 hypothetical protein AEK19_MT1971 [Utricularia reniformis]
MILQKVITRSGVKNKKYDIQTRDLLPHERIDWKKDGIAA